MKKWLKHIVVFSLCMAAACLASFSCKKQENVTTKKYLSGYITLSGNHPYIYMTDPIRFKVGGVSHPLSKAMGLYYSVNSSPVFIDTLYYPKPDLSKGQKGPVPLDEWGRVSVDMAPVTLADMGIDSLASFTVTFTVYPIDSDQYYATSTSSTFVTVRDHTNAKEGQPLSIPELPEPYSPDDGSGTVTMSAEAGGRTWLARNLSDITAGGVPLGNSPAMTHLGGLFYTWEEAVNACPEGYTLPSSADWDALLQRGADSLANVGTLLLDATFNGERMWEFWPEVEITNSTGLSLIPMGYCNAKSGKFSLTWSCAAFWTSDKEGDKAVYRYISADADKLYKGLADTVSTAMPVRCVREVVFK